MPNKYNRLKDKPKGTEKKFGVEHHICSTAALPSSFDLRTSTNYFPAILNQLSLGSCVDNEMSNALKFCIGKESGIKAEWQPSRLFLYWNARKADDQNADMTQDTGSSLLGCLEGIKVKGACSENNWPYNINMFSVCPPKNAFGAAATHNKDFQYLQVSQNLISIKQALIAGYPVVIGISVYSSFESDTVASTGIVPIPDIKTETLLGLHCVSIVAYTDSTQTFTCSNSWGSSGWGQKGYFTIPYNYILDPTLCDTLYQVRYFK